MRDLVAQKGGNGTRAESAETAQKPQNNNSALCRNYSETRRSLGKYSALLDGHFL